MIQILGLSPEPGKAEIEPSLGRFTPHGNVLASQAFDCSKSSHSSAVEPLPDAFSRVARDTGKDMRNTTIPVEQYSMSKTLGIVEDPPKPANSVSSLAASPVAKGIGEGIERENAALSASSQPISKAEGLAVRTVLEGLPIEEIDVEPLSRIVFHTDPRGLAADRFRFLRMRIRELSEVKKLKSLLITSALSLDGKSTVSLNLATALADRGRNAVLLLEADLYHPTLAQRLGLSAGPGLAECLASGLTPLAAVRRIEPLGCYFLPAGSQLANPSDLLHGDEFATIMQSLLPYFNWIVIDSPPVVPVADALALARQADASLLVVRAGQTPSDAVEAALESLGPAHVMGVILNGVEDLDRLYSKYNKYYGPPAPPIARKRRGSAE